MKRVVAYLQGGLGNQCFIYATARALAIRANAELHLNLDYFLEDKVYRRNLKLDYYSISGVIDAVSSKMRRVAKKIRYAVLSRLRKNGYGRNYVCDYHPYNFFELPVDWSGRLTLDGYWQSEKYYYDCRDQILRDFTLKDQSWISDDCVAREILISKIPVFVHMRSYKEVPNNAGGMSVGVKFYNVALKTLREKLGDGITLFLFSDDLDWAGSRINECVFSKGLKIVKVERRNDIKIPNEIRDFELLRMCHHGIVANSSFSRFAAWLGELQNLKEGRTPIYIHNSKKKNGYCPERWVRLGVD